MPTITARKCQDPTEAAVKELPSPYIGSFDVPVGSGARIFLKPDSAFCHATTRATQLTSLLDLVYGQGGETFRDYADHIQENVLWLAAGLAKEIEETLELMGAEMREKVKAGADHE